jgi:hypothetical protein
MLLKLERVDETTMPWQGIANEEAFSRHGINMSLPEVPNLTTAKSRQSLNRQAVQASRKLVHVCRFSGIGAC